MWRILINNYKVIGWNAYKTVEWLFQWKKMKASHCGSTPRVTHHRPSAALTRMSVGNGPHVSGHSSRSVYIFHSARCAVITKVGSSVLIKCCAIKIPPPPFTNECGLASIIALIVLVLYRYSTINLKNLSMNVGLNIFSSRKWITDMI